MWPAAQCLWKPSLADASRQGPDRSNELTVGAQDIHGGLTSCPSFSLLCLTLTCRGPYNHPRCQPPFLAAPTWFCLPLLWPRHDHFQSQEGKGSEIPLPSVSLGPSSLTADPSWAGFLQQLCTPPGPPLKASRLRSWAAEANSPVPTFGRLFPGMPPWNMSHLHVSLHRSFPHSWALGQPARKLIHPSESLHEAGPFPHSHLHLHLPLSPAAFLVFLLHQPCPWLFPLLLLGARLPGLGGTLWRLALPGGPMALYCPGSWLCSSLSGGLKCLFPRCHLGFSQGPSLKRLHNPGDPILRLQLGCYFLRRGVGPFLARPLAPG